MEVEPTVKTVPQLCTPYVQFGRTCTGPGHLQVAAAVGGCGSVRVG
eukprot:COSAG03_NODE_20110_length_324_cov_0.924444_1_plen_45_part_10